MCGADVFKEDRAWACDIAIENDMTGLVMDAPGTAENPFPWEPESVSAWKAAIDYLANLRDVDLQGANLQRANLHGTDLQESHLQKANLEKANLSEQRLSYNNILDIDSAINCINEFNEPTSAIIKHEIKENVSDLYNYIRCPDLKEISERNY